MTTAPPAKPQQLPALPKLSFAQSLGQQDRFNHRLWIAVRVEALMDGYWSSRPADAVREVIMQDWMEALEDFAPEEISAACKAYLRGQNRARKPKTGDIVELMVAARTELRRALPPPSPPPSPRPDPVSAEERRRKAAEIIAQFRGGASE